MDLWLLPRPQLTIFARLKSNLYFWNLDAPLKDSRREFSPALRGTFTSHDSLRWLAAGRRYDTVHAETPCCLKKGGKPFAFLHEAGSCESFRVDFSYSLASGPVRRVHRGIKP